MRLDKFLSNIGTRTEVKKLIKSGAIAVNGVTAKKSDIKIDENKDVITFNGEVVNYKEYIYLVMNKPQGYISAVWDKYQPVVVDLIPEEYKKFEPYPVGRLDIDTEGLLILTNDGELTHNLTSPKKDIKKKYFAITDEPMTKEDIITFSQGIELKDFTTKPALLEISENPCEVYITISEGKFHQVKRMCRKCGKTVTYLKRVSIGGLELDENIKIGEITEYSKKELTDKIYTLK